MYHAIYRDDRDEDESAIAECASVDDAVDAIVRYFRRQPNAYAHLVSWRVVTRDGEEMVMGITLDLT